MNIIRSTKNLVTLGFVTAFMGVYVLKSNKHEVEDDEDEFVQ
jgi:hypothetical protein